MLNSIIKLSLRYRAVTIALALVLTVYGGFVLSELPIDVFPDLNRPRVTVMTEAPGMAPEEVETLVTIPLESSLNGATGVQAVRSASGVGLSVINVEFDWNTDIYVARQTVTEKVQLAADRLPEGISPQLAPISSIMGQVLIVGMTSENGETDPIELRTLADWVVRQRLLTLPGVAQVIVMGGGRKQFQVLANPDEMLKYDVTLEEVEQAVAASNANATGGYLEEGGEELLVRSIGRIRGIDELRQVVVKAAEGRPVLLNQVARVQEAAQIKRGEAAVNGSPGVLLIVSKQPGADTREMTGRVVKALQELKPSLPGDVRLDPTIYQQKEFIDRSIENVIHALRDGGILVVIVLFLFLLNFRTTFITLTAIPLSIVASALVFKLLGMSINTMTLGGLAVAIGELVDDAIVDVENIFRRLRENKHSAHPKPPLRVVYEASSEVRNSIVFSTILVVLVFVPLFALSGMEGRLFTPLGVAYIVSIVASLVVSLTVTPVLAYWLLPNARFMEHERDGFLLRFLKWIAGYVIRFSVRHPWPILASVVICVLLSGLAAWRLGRDFLPAFNEGTAQVNVFLPPGVSLAESNRVAEIVDRRIANIEGVTSFARRTGRAELDEHAEGVNVSEIIVNIDPASGRSREEINREIRDELAEVPGIFAETDQPLAHLISHMLSGVKAKIGIKLYGDDLDVLRSKAKEIEAAIDDVPGVADLIVEQQIEIPQLAIELDRQRLAQYGITAGYVNEFVETAMNGRTVSEIVDGERKFDLVVRLDDPFRQDPAKLRELSLHLPGGGRVPLGQVAAIARGSGPNTIHRENVRRRIVISCNAVDRSLGDVVGDIRERLEPVREKLPTGYYIEYAGQYENAESAALMMLILGAISLGGMFLALYTLFRSTNLALQVLAALPMAAIGAVASLYVTGQSLTIASLVGFISLSGIASRNGILLIAHYLHLVKHEGERFTPQMIERAGKERLAPMLMTALTAGIALIPLVMAAGEPGKEILYPVATVILGGLISSTLLDFFVHPALFWVFGRGQAERQIQSGRAGDDLDEWNERESRPPVAAGQPPHSRDAAVQAEIVSAEP